MSQQARLYIYLPFVDEHATGMQRFGSEIILAIMRTGMDAEILIGHLQGKPAWLEGLPHRVLIGPSLAGMLPRAALPAIRILWLQFVFPLVARSGSTLLALAHELAPRPLVPQISVVHDLTHMKTFAQRRGRIERIRNFLWVAGLKRSRKIIAISQATQRDLLETFDLPDGKVVVIYEGYDPDIFRPASEIGSAAPYLLYAGTLAPNKNIPFLLRAFARARGSSPIRLKLVGKQSTADVEALLQPLSEEVRSAIDFVGFVSDEELAALMQQCTAFVFPSLNEGFGLAVVEAMACGAPIISSDAGSLLEVVGDGGVLLSPTDEEKWVAQIAAVLGDPDIRHQLRSRALARSAAFSWSNAASAYLSLLRTTRLEKR